MLASAGALAASDCPLSIEGLDGWLHDRAVTVLDTPCIDFYPYPKNEPWELKVVNHAQVIVSYDLSTRRAVIDFRDNLVEQC